MRILDETSERGVTERRFDLQVDHAGHHVPAILWTPADGPATGLVLVGHGYGLEKRTPYILSLARRLVRHHSIAAVSIDGPEHGDRIKTGDNWWSDAVTDHTVADWHAILRAVQDHPDVGAGVPVAYWGLSMGTIFGLPFVAAHQDELRAAVLGLMGVAGPTSERIERDAKSLRADLPVLFLLQRDDELFALDQGLALFDAFGTSDKRLHLNVGAHSAVPVDEFESTQAFLARHLLG
ncbi:MAG TPA: hypothetical protein VFV35_04920 [Acidimicrobiales bacterium]|nr:hypothetical protein [Acidimicrobiales bacterium]